MNIVDRQLIGNNTQIMVEEEDKKTINSLKKFIEYYIEFLINYYGGPYNNEPNPKINELALGD
jgi:hypothetical protein